MKRFRHTYHLLTALTILMCLSGCTQDENILSSGGQEVEESHTKLLLSITMPSAATKATPVTLPGTTEENELKKVTLFIVGKNAVQEYTLQGSKLQTPLMFTIANANSGSSQQIYVAANMSDAQISAVKAAADKNPSMTIGDISEITGTNGFLMTAQAVGSDGSTRINITPEETTRIKANLSRVMSKVLLTCTTENEGYVKLSKPNGYIRLSDVHYALETTNRKFFPFAKAGNEDPNYSMTETLNQSDNFFTYPDAVNASSHVALKYESNRVNSSNENHYTEGIYCLENTVKTDYNFGQDISIPKQVATYVKIAAKFTPKYIDGDKGYTETQAMQKLQANNGTFYTCKKAPESYKHICYSSAKAGVEFLNGKGGNFTTEDFTPHEGGWQYYETFVASPTSFTDGSNLKRNNYYIMNITSMTAPVQEKTIEINTTVANWTVKGKTVIEIETNN